MIFPLDPTTSDLSPREILLELPSRSPLERALRAADVRANLGADTEQLLDDLSQVALHEAAAQVRYAAPLPVHYYHVPRLGHLDAASFESLVETSRGGFGGQIRAVEEMRERAYLVCSVPEGGTQAQLSVDESSRETTVATFEQGSDLLAVRAPDAETADVTKNELMAHSALDSSNRVSFLDEKFWSALESDVVERYTQVVLDGVGEAANTGRIELSAESRGDGRTNLLNDEVVQTLLGRPDTRRRSARAILDLDTDGERNNFAHPSVSVNFSQGTISFERFLPEIVFVRVDRAVQSITEI